MTDRGYGNRFDFPKIMRPAAAARCHVHRQARTRVARNCSLHPCPATVSRAVVQRHGLNT